MAERRLSRLFREQGGLCWICGQPMVPARQHTAYTRPGSFEATLDHLAPRGTTNGKERPARAAHAKCNSVRHHYSPDDPRLAVQVAYMRRRFADPGFARQVLGIRESSDG